MKIVFWRRDWPGIRTVIDTPLLSIRYSRGGTPQVEQRRWHIKVGRHNHTDLHIELVTRKYPKERP
jgi:hypothetical protein